MTVGERQSVTEKSPMRRLDLSPLWKSGMEAVHEEVRASHALQGRK